MPRPKADAQHVLTKNTSGLRALQAVQLLCDNTRTDWTLPAGQSNAEDAWGYPGRASILLRLIRMAVSRRQLMAGEG